MIWRQPNQAVKTTRPEDRLLAWGLVFTMYIATRAIFDKEESKMSIFADKMPLHILVNKFDEEFWWITVYFGRIFIEEVVITEVDRKNKLSCNYEEWWTIQDDKLSLMCICKEMFLRSDMDFSKKLGAVLSKDECQ